MAPMVATPLMEGQDSTRREEAYKQGFADLISHEAEAGRVASYTAPAAAFLYRPGQLITRSDDLERVMGRLAELTGIPSDEVLVDDVSPNVSRISGEFDVPETITRLRDPRVWEGNEVPRAQPHHVTVGYGAVLGHPALPPQLPMSDPVPPQLGRASYGRGVTVGLCDTRYLSSAEHLVWFTDAVEGEQPRNLDVDQFLEPGTGGEGRLGLLQGHGTFVAGILRETAPGVRIRVEEALDPSGLGDEQMLVAAMIAAAQDAEVILAPLGCLTMGNEPPLLIEDALRRMPGKLVVAAAGNGGDTRMRWPAAFPFVVGVAAVEVGVGGRAGRVSPDPASSYGVWVDASAPGTWTSTYIRGALPDALGGATFDEPFATWSGTSFAPAQVAGHLAGVISTDTTSTSDAMKLLREAPRWHPDYGVLVGVDTVERPGFPTDPTRSRQWRLGSALSLDTVETRDLLGREVLASHVDLTISATLGLWSPEQGNVDAAAVGRREVVLLVDGPWGSGKSTLVNQALDPRPTGDAPHERKLRNPLVIKYDAWRESAIAPEWWSIGADIVKEIHRSRSLAAVVGMGLTGLAARVLRSPALSVALVVGLAVAMVGLADPPSSRALQEFVGVVAGVAATALLAGQALFWTAPAFGRLQLSSHDSVLSAVAAEVERVRRWSPRDTDLQAPADTAIGVAIVLTIGVLLMVPLDAPTWQSGLGAWVIGAWEVIIPTCVIAAAAAFGLWCWPAPPRNTDAATKQKWSRGRCVGSSAGAATLIMLLCASQVGWAQGLGAVLTVGLWIAAVQMWWHASRALRRPMVVVIDNVDRCQADRVSRLIETVHTILKHEENRSLLRLEPGTHLRRVRAAAPLAVLILADGRWIRQAFSEQFKAFAPLGTPVNDLGADFLNKVFDHTVRVPQLTTDQRRDFLRHLTNSSATTPTSSPPPTPAEQSAEGPVEDNQDSGSRAAPNEVRAQLDKASFSESFDPTLDEAIASIKDEQARVALETERQKKAFETSPDGQHSVVVEHLLLDHADTMPPNPRLIRRIGMTYTMLLALRATLNHRESLDMVARASSLAVQYPVLADELVGTPRAPTSPAPDSPWNRKDVQALVGRSADANGDPSPAGIRTTLERIAVCLGRPTIE